MVLAIKQYFRDTGGYCHFVITDKPSVRKDARKAHQKVHKKETKQDDQLSCKRLCAIGVCAALIITGIYLEVTTKKLKKLG